MTDRERLRAVICGAVQGVGFRPFVYRIASDLDLAGWVTNTPAGVLLEAEGERSAVREFLRRLETEKPPASFIQNLEPTFLEPAGYHSFRILPSAESGAKSAIVLPDLATCEECIAELFDPSNRRYRYPFTNCTNCGPRYSIVHALPYDRPNTTMSMFEMCPDCRREYDDPADRRFHAQPNACAICGPRLALWDPSGKEIETQDAALQAAADAVLGGKIVAVKGIGGMQLLVDAGNENAVRQLRLRKQREEKPLAVMYGSIDAARAECVIGDMEERVLRSMQAPIVLLNRLAGSRIAPSVAPGSPTIGAMLPYSPLHYLLLAEIGRPVVATSGNLSDEPICTDETEVLNRLSGIADLFLVHDRGIARHVDDSVVQVVLDREMVLRRARGYAPLPATLAASGPPILAVGAHQKSAVALSVGDQAFVSQHIGDLESVPAYNAFTLVIGDLSRIYEHAPQAIACDMHPDYLSTQYAVASGLKTISVQHHYAHVLSCMADNRLEPPVLGIAWDGSGLGSDDTLWGGEFLLVEDLEHRRIASLRPFRLPGGASAAREPRRCALGILAEMSAADDAFPAILVSAFNPSQIKVLRGMIEAGINSPITTSIGRLFDAVAALTGIRETVRHEGQAAMELEFAARRSESEESYRMPIVNAGDRRILDWEPMIRAIIEDSAEGRSTELIARRFHNTLAEAATAVATHANADHVALTGGCFQNRLLTECCVTRLRDAGLQPYWHQRIPPNDGGIAVGQILAAHRAMGAGEK